MKPLIVLLATFCITAVVIKFTTGNYNLALSGRVALCAMLLFTAIAHFAFTKGMVMMIPTFVPFKQEIVYLTGILEIILGIGLLIQQSQVYCAWILISMFIILLPANIHAAIKHINYQNAGFDGSGISYLWFRIPLQLFFVAWTYVSAIMH